MLVQGDMLDIGCDIEDFKVFLEGIPCEVVEIYGPNSVGSVSFVMPSTFQLAHKPIDQFPDFYCNKTEYHLQVSGNL